MPKPFVGWRADGGEQNADYCWLVRTAYADGEQWAWMIVVLAAMLGQIGCRVVVLVLAGTITAQARRGVRRYSEWFLRLYVDSACSRQRDYKGYSSTIPIARFIDAILNRGK